MKKIRFSLQRSSTQRGTSLLIALGLITVIVLVSLGVATVVLSSTRESANVNRATEAFYAAQGALEEGLLRNQENPSQEVKSLRKKKMEN